MKKILLLISAFIVGIAFHGCEESDDDPAGLRNVGVVSVLSDINPAIFISGELENSYVAFVADTDEGASFEDAYVVGSYNGVGDRVKLQDIQSFPADIEITAADAASALGLNLGEIESGDYFVFEVVTVSNGKITRSNGALTVRVVCPFDPALTYGRYNASSAGWGVNGGVDIVPDEEDPYTVYVSGLATIDGLVEDRGPLVMHINPLSFEVTADKTVVASNVEPWGLPYTNIAYEGFGIFDSCTGTYTMTFEITVDQGSFGSFNFEFTR
ncbi:MAG: hypothetical protein JG782_1753 [Anaerophaga sp.]|uniref:hypothetical protein n=1 Tax=Anaerophaga thermohalophila TaxID=177400 RepID=UPI0002D5431B|nr:hypothetical protein [Anaerophaga thermohalophila]MBZ4677133.1 hypothetical protein [Anaerophaga sp.]MDK2842810.1 hypothetical protein [Anaerophaga sp.]